MGYDDRMREIRDRRENATKKEREARDEKDLDQIAELLGDAANGFVRVPDAAPELVGHVVFRRPTKQEIARYRAIVRRDSSERGAVEAKAKAGQELAAQCRVWPEPDQYEQLLEAHPMVADAIAVELFRLAEGGAREEAKS